MELELLNGLVSLAAAVLTLATVAIGLLKKTYDWKNNPIALVNFVLIFFRKFIIAYVYDSKQMYMNDDWSRIWLTAAR
jgi:hypothetical protein